MKCRVCGSDEDHPAFQAREMMFGSRTVFDYFQCIRCSCLQISSFPVNINEYYSGDYYSYMAERREPFFLRRWLARARDSYAVTGVGSLGRFLYKIFPNHNLKSLQGKIATKYTRILDVGCGSGKLLFALRELGYSRVLGVDPFLSSGIIYDNGLVIKNCKLSEVGGEYDLIMFHHSFEHVPDPLATLREVVELLSPNGCCYLRVPIVSSFAWEHYGVNWAQLDAPRHFYLHSCESMRMLCDRVGLSIQNVTYDSTAFQFWASEQISKDIPLRDPRSDILSKENSPVTAGELAEMEARAGRLNAEGRGDQACFLIRRRQELSC